VGGRPFRQRCQRDRRQMASNVREPVSQFLCGTICF
jgi:hypothetical protein